MSTPRYTPEPWKAVRGDTTGSWWVRSSDDVFSISLIGDEETVFHPSRANAERIVACVNACAGIADPSAVPEMLAALKAAEVELVMAGKPGSEQVIRIVMAAIARAEGLGE